MGTESNIQTPNPPTLKVSQLLLCACYTEAQEGECGLGQCSCPGAPSLPQSHCMDTGEHAPSLQSQLLLLLWLHNAVVWFSSGVKAKAVTARSPAGQSCPHCRRSRRDEGCRMRDVGCLPATCKQLHGEASPSPPPHPENQISLLSSSFFFLNKKGPHHVIFLP